jgi:hypothetical protein
MSSFMDIFNTPWSIKDDTKGRILLHDWGQLDPLIPEIQSSFILDSVLCPICEKDINIPPESHVALVTCNQGYSFQQAIKRKLINHCKKHHCKEMLWPCIDGARIFHPIVNSLLMTQKLIFSASKGHQFLGLELFPFDMATVLGKALGSIHKEKKDFRVVDCCEEKERFFKEVEDLLESIRKCCILFDWRTFFQQFSSDFEAINFTRIFLRKGLFLDPVFPAFQEMNLRTREFLNCTRRCNPNEAPLDQVIDTIYYELYFKNKDLDSNGSSTYGEITRGGVRRIIDAIQTVFIPLLDNDSACKFRFLDVGAGLMTTVVHIAQEIPGFYCGLELCANRSRIFATSYKRLLQSGVLQNDKIAFVHDDVKSVQSFDFDCVYAFDEAFSQEDWEHMLEVFCNSKRAKFLITFKTMKVRAGNKAKMRDMMEEYGLEHLKTVELKMKISHEVCNAGFFKKKVLPNIPDSTRSEEPYMLTCNSFWNSNNKGQLLDELIHQIDEDNDAKKKERKHKKSKIL